MPIVDAHVHLWEAGSPRAAHRQQPLLADEALRGMDAAGIDAAILIPLPWDPASDATCLRAARAHPERFRAMVSVSLEPQSGIVQLESVRKQHEVCGLRYILNEDRHGVMLREGELDWLWSAASAAGMPVALAISRHLAHVGDIARRFPRLRLLLDHLAVPINTTGAAAFAHLSLLVDLARHDNVAVKASATPSFSEAPFPYADIHPFLERAFRAYGASRFFWGSDITKLPCSWRQSVAAFTDHLAFLTDSHRASVMGDGLAQWLRLPFDAPRRDLDAARHGSSRPSIS